MSRAWVSFSISGITYRFEIYWQRTDARQDGVHCLFNRAACKWIQQASQATSLRKILSDIFATVRVLPEIVYRLSLVYCQMTKRIYTLHVPCRRSCVRKYWINAHYCKIWRLKGEGGTCSLFTTSSLNTQWFCMKVLVSHSCDKRRCWFDLLQNDQTTFPYASHSMRLRSRIQKIRCGWMPLCFSSFSSR